MSSQGNQMLQYLTFCLSKEMYAIDISQVKEVLEYTNMTRIPQTPDYIHGVINLRGNVVPVVDMRTKFKMEQVERTVNTCIIIVEIESGSEISQVGALVDSVQEVMEMSSDQIEPPPKLGTRLNVEFINEMGKQDDHFVIILNIDKVFSVDDISMFDELTESDIIAESIEEEEDEVTT